MGISACALCICSFMHVFIYLFIEVLMHLCIYVFRYICKSQCVHVSTYLNVYVDVSWYIYMYIYRFFTYVNVCMLATKPQPNWRTFFSSKLHLKWLLCIFVLPNAMPCWDDCCVDESPQTDLSGKQMADDRREFKRGTFDSWFFLGGGTTS